MASWPQHEDEHSAALHRYTLDEERMRIIVAQGDFAATGDPNVEISTVLGSCVAACLIDPVSRVGGMNHFLLPGDDANDINSASRRYGVNLMELLINELLRLGARRKNMQAKLFGGASTCLKNFDTGDSNTRFALDFMHFERIPVVARCVGGDRARRIRFNPTTGAVYRSFLYDTAPKEIAEAGAPRSTSNSSFELFGEKE